MPFEPDPEFWKNLTYSTAWKPHVEKVNRLESKILKRFPKDKFSELGIKFGFGAKSTEWLKVPPDQKGEPDVELFYNYKKICYIEVTGSPKVDVPPKPIWIRPDKFDVAKKADRDTWFYTEYRNNTWVLNRDAVEPYKDNIVRPLIKTDPNTGKKIPEKYIEIPYEKAFKEDVMLNWIEKQINSLK
jgi:hypothetical protein